MISKNQIKYIKSLQMAKFRQKYDIFIAEGEKIAHEVFLSKNFEIENIYATNDWLIKYPNIQHPLLEEVSTHEMSQISNLTNPSNIFMVLNCDDKKLDVDMVSQSYSFLLDGVQDPGNVGTILRLADWFGIKAVIRTEETADFYHPKVIQSSMGSFCKQHFYTASQEVITDLHKKVKFYGMDMYGSSLGTTKISESAVIVFGNEGHGISDSIQELLHEKIAITGSQDKIAESLNVGTTAAIVAHHLSLRQ